jgi:hypothetical protein
MKIADLVPEQFKAEIDLGEIEWIPVQWVTGKKSKVGFRELFRHAHEISFLDISDPLEKFVLLRYLIALTYLAHAQYPNEDAWNRVQDGQAFPEEALQSLLGRMEQQWYLLHPKTPFMQSPLFLESFTRELEANARLSDVAVPISILFPHIPSGINEQVWYGQKSREYDPGSVAIGLLLRHFAGLPGNEGSITGKGIDTSSGGLTLVGPRSISIWYRIGETLSTTLIGNLTTTLVENVTSDSKFHWEDPLNIASLSTDALALYTYSPLATYLVANPGSTKFTHVMRAPYRINKAVRDSVGVIARLSDPHTVRIPKKDSATNAELNCFAFLALETGANQYANVYAFQRNDPDLTKLSSNLLDGVRHCYFKPLDLHALSIDVGGSATGPRIESVTDGAVDQSPYLISGEAGLIWRTLLKRAAGQSKSMRSQARYQIGITLKAEDSAAVVNCKKQFNSQMWALLETSLSTLFYRVSNGEEVTSLDEVTRDEWINAALQAFDTVLIAYTYSPQAAGLFYKQRSELRSKLWQQLNS